MKKMLIADKTEMNKSILFELFDGQYEILQLTNSEAAFNAMLKYRDETSIILINESIAKNINKDKAQTLIDMKVFDKTPVIIILNESYKNVRLQSDIRLPYSDVVASPVNPYIIRRRIANLVELFSHKNELENLVEEQTKKIVAQNKALQIQQKKINTINNDMLDTLSTVIEYRDVESGKHIHRIRKFTEALLRVFSEKYPKYDLTEEKIELITSASSLHDIGKIAIPDSILLSPRRLTYDEFKIMKQHTVKGCEILEQLDSVEKNEYYSYCYDICRYHHEKWDGMGYPEGLVGDQIPFWAQVVSLADCYDALTSERPYKAAYSHEKAVEMIRSGACGAFSDEMMECFGYVLPEFKKLAKEYADVTHVDHGVSEKKNTRYDDSDEDHSKDIYNKMDRDDLINTIEHQKQLMEKTHKRDCKILYDDADIVFEFDILRGTCHERKGDVLSLLGYAPKNYAEAMNVFSESITENYRNKFIRSFRLENIIEQAKKGKKRITLECPVNTNGLGEKIMRFAAIPIVENDRVSEVFATAIYLSDAVMPEALSGLSEDRDIITGLWNFDGMKKQIDDYLSYSGKKGKHLLIIVDVDNFRTINRQTSYRFGNDILRDIANVLKDLSSDGNIIGRVEDDNFIVFINDCPDSSRSVAIVDEIFHSLHKKYNYEGKAYPEISACIGVATYPVNGRDFDELFENASKAVDIAKINGKDMYLFYNENMKETWEINAYTSYPETHKDNEIELVDFEKYFIPVMDARSGRVISYDMVELSELYSNNYDDIYDSVYYGTNITALSLNSLKRLISSVYSMQQQTELPRLMLLTVFNGRDYDTVLHALAEIIVQFPIDTGGITLMVSQDMIEKMTMKELVELCSGIRALGFGIGLYNVGSSSFNAKCFTEKLFDRVVFSGSFLNGIENGMYPIELIIYFIGYFTELGVEVVLPSNTSEDIIDLIKIKTHLSFCVHKDEAISLSDFVSNIDSADVIPEYPVLSHENTSLILSERMYDEILEQTKSFIAEWIPRLDVLKLSGSFRNMYGYEPNLNNFVSNLNVSSFIHNDDVRKFTEKLNATRSESEVSDSLIRVYRKKDDSYVWNKVSFVSVKNAAGIPVRIIAVFVDVSEGRTETVDSVRKDRTDYITNLYNKQAVENKIKSYLLNEGVSGSHAMINAEICGFEELEKRLGSVFANAILKEIAQNIRELFRDSDIIGRSSGSTFTIFLKKMSNYEKLLTKAKQICTCIDNTYQSDTGNIRIYGKVGIGLYPSDGRTYSELYSNSLSALYFSKHNLNSSVVFASEINNKIKRLHD